MKTATDLIKELAESRNKEEKDKAEKRSEEVRIWVAARNEKLFKPLQPLINIINESAVKFKDVVQCVQVTDDRRNSALVHHVTFRLLELHEFLKTPGHELFILSAHNDYFSVKKYGGYDMRYGTGSYDAHKTMFSAKSADELIPGLISLIADRVRDFEKNKNK